jgi:hypothetical protein
MATRAEPRLGYVPHFSVTTVGGIQARYRDIWQHRNLVLILAQPQQREAAARYASQLAARQAEFEQAETTVMVTTDAVAGLPAPAVVIADRWGEILHIDSSPAADPSQLPSVDELLSWVQFARMQCPECPP